MENDNTNPTSSIKNTSSVIITGSTKPSKHEDDGDSGSHRGKHREDREAKRKARSNNAEASSAVPGAHSSTGEHKSRSKSSKSGRRSSSAKSNDHSSRSSRRSDEKSAHRSSRGPATVPGAQPELSSPRSSRSRRSDEKSAYRSSRSDGSASVPGALAEQSSPKGRSKRDEKGKERRGTRASKPGAEASTSSRDRSKAKSSGRSKENNINLASNNDEGPPQFGEDGEPVVAAMIVEEEEKEDEDTTKNREQASISEMAAAQAEQERQRLQEQNQRLQEEMGRIEAERREKELETKKKKKRNMIICVVLVLVIGGGVAAFFALQGGSSPPIDQQEGTPSPSVATVTLATVNPTNSPSSGPTDIQLKYEQPSPEECERIAAGLPIDNEEGMLTRSFDIPMEVDLLDGNDINALVPELETKIESLLVPDLIGCSRELFDKRRLRHQPKANSDASMMSSMSVHHRELQSSNTISIRFAIAKAIVTAITLTGDACEKSSSPNCSTVAVNLDLTVRGDEDIGLLAEVIQNVFPTGKDIRPELELVAPFNTIIIGIMRSLDRTLAPTIAPTGTESENASGVPSSSPSTSPTSGPDIGTSAPSDPAPVIAPTTAPSKSPSLSPSKAPTPPPTLTPTTTPPPTFAPQPGLTLQPSPSPTVSPSRNPSSPPSASPSTKPSVALSSNPTIQASSAPSTDPTSGPTSGPTSTPTLVCGGNTVTDYDGATLVGPSTDFGVGIGTQAVDLGFGSFRWTNSAGYTFNFGNFDSHVGLNVWSYTNGDDFDCGGVGSRTTEVHLQFVSGSTSSMTLSDLQGCRYRLDLYISTTTCALPTLGCGENTVADYDGATLVGPADFGVGPGTQVVNLGFGSFRWTNSAGYTFNFGNFDSHDGSNVWYYTNGDDFDCGGVGSRTTEVHLQFVSGSTSSMTLSAPQGCRYRLDLYISTTTCALPAPIPMPAPTRV